MSDRKDESVQWVRMRDRRSAEQFADFVAFERESEAVEILEWPGRDYAYRVKATRDEWGKYVLVHLELAQATNFKDQVKDNLRGVEGGKDFVEALSSVWSVMFNFQHDLKRPARKKGGRKSFQDRYEDYGSIKYELLTDEELDELVIEDEGWEAYQDWLKRNHNG